MTEPPTSSRGQSVSRFQNRTFTSTPAGISMLFMVASWPVLTHLVATFQPR